MARASSRNRASVPSAQIRSGRSTLTASRRSSCRSSTSYTSAKPPLPTRARTSYSTPSASASRSGDGTRLRHGYRLGHGGLVVRHHLGSGVRFRACRARRARQRAGRKPLTGLELRGACFFSGGGGGASTTGSGSGASTTGSGSTVATGCSTTGSGAGAGARDA